MRWSALALVILLGGCATAFPREVMRTVDTAITVEALRGDPAAFKGRRVIVGGEILSTQPRPGETVIELLARRLESDDSPEYSDRSPGRVLLHTADFLDPAVYAPGRRITVIGTVTGAEERKVGELPYRYPVIAVERIRLWPRDVLAAPYYPWGPWPYYDPFFPGPFYPYGGWWW
jgi:outer membrane lipoprotein